MLSIFKPGQKLLNKLSYFQKFLFIGLLLILPLFIGMFFEISNMEKISIINNKKIGIELNHSLVNLLQDLQQYRGMVYADKFSSEPLYEIEVSNKIDEIYKDIEEINNSNLYRNENEINVKWQEIEQEWHSLNGNYLDLSSDDFYNSITLLIMEVIDLIDQVLTSSDLNINSEHVETEIIDMLYRDIPLATEKTGQIRALLTGGILKGDISDGEKENYIILFGEAKFPLNQIDKTIFKYLNDNNYSENEAFFKQIKASTTKINTLINSIDTILSDIDSSFLGAGDFFNMATEAIDEGYNLFYIGEEHLIDSLNQELTHLTQVKIMQSILSAFLLLLILYFFISFYLSIRSTVNYLVDASNNIINENFDFEVRLDTQDEMKQVESSFNAMIKKIKYLINSHMNTEEELYKAIEEKSYQINHDLLTNLPNRNYLIDYFNDHIKQHGLNTSILFLDLDRFKIINDTKGHHFGDLLLKEIANRLTKFIDTDSKIIKFGGNEFVILTNNLSEEKTIEFTEYILNLFSFPFSINETEVFVSTSIGISFYPKNGKELDTLIKKADIAMHYAKQEGNTYQLYNKSLDDAFNWKMELEKDLRKALIQGELLVYYQPQVDLSTNKIKGAEALLRWNHPDKGMISPAKFIPLAEETGLIIPIGEWVIRHTTKQLKNWIEEGVDVDLSINVSMKQFFHENFIKVIKENIEENNLPPSKLTVEITESIALYKENLVIEKLKELKKLGVKIALDDFGTGYSSLSYLKIFPIDILKIDKSFIDDIDIDKKSLSITEKIINLAHDFCFKVVGEGVETEEQLNKIKLIQCDIVQGYVFYKPLTAEGFIEEYWNSETMKNDYDHEK